MVNRKRVNAHVIESLRYLNFTHLGTDKVLRIKVVLERAKPLHRTSWKIGYLEQQRKKERGRERYREKDSQTETEGNRQTERGKRMIKIIYKMFVFYHATKSDIFLAKSPA